MIIRDTNRQSDCNDRCRQTTGNIYHKAVIEYMGSESEGLATLHMLAVLSRCCPLAIKQSYQGLSVEISNDDGGGPATLLGERRGEIRGGEGLHRGIGNM